VLGYDVAAEGGLVMNAEEAGRVQEIFAIASDAGSLAEALQRVNERGLGRTLVLNDVRPTVSIATRNNQIWRLGPYIPTKGAVAVDGFRIRISAVPFLSWYSISPRFSAPMSNSQANETWIIQWSRCRRLCQC
jgi:hypothetical protein